MKDLESLSTEASMKVASYLDSQPDIKQSDLALKIGVSEPVISLLRRGLTANTNPQGSRLITANVVKKVMAFFHTDGSAWATSNYKKAHNLLYRTKYHKIQGILDGPRGSGKSFTAESFVRSFPSESFLVTCDRDMGIGDFMHELADQVGVVKSGTRYQLRKKISENFGKMESPALILDEMEEVRTDLIYSSVKGLYDYRNLYRHLGIAIIGANEFLKSLETKAERKNPKSYPQLLSRFASNYTKLEEMTLADVEFICTTYFGIDSANTHLWLYGESEKDYRRLERKIAAYLRELNMKKKSHEQDRAA